MHPAVAIALLALGVAAILLPRPRWLSWVVPPVLAAVAVLAGVLTPDAAGSALRPLAAPVAFVVLAVPFAVLLDRLGLFQALANQRVPRSATVPPGRLAAPEGRARGGPGYGLGTLWVLAGLVVALLNLDAAVVLLTPLYLRLASRGGSGRVRLGVQPLLLSCLASSALPISNLTNLIAGSALHLSSTGFLVHLAAPTLAASGAGYLAYRRLGPRLDALEPPGVLEPTSAVPAMGGGRPVEAVVARGPVSAITARARARARARRPGWRPGWRPGRPPAGTGRPTGSHRRQVVLAGTVAVAVVVGFLLVPSLGGQPWEVAAGGDLVLALALRSLPLAAVPWRVVLTVLGLGVLASAAAGSLHVDALLAAGTPAGVARDAGLGAVGGSLFNNLPALLVALPGLAHHRGFASWAFLLGVNVGPLAVPSGTLAGLLWLETMARLGTPLRERDYLRLAWRVALPSLVVGLGVLLALRAGLGPG